MTLFTWCPQVRGGAIRKWPLADGKGKGGLTGKRYNMEILPIFSGAGYMDAYTGETFTELNT